MILSLSLSLCTNGKLAPKTVLMLDGHILLLDGNILTFQ